MKDSHLCFILLAIFLIYNYRCNCEGFDLNATNHYTKGVIDACQADISTCTPACKTAITALQSTCGTYYTSVPENIKTKMDECIVPSGGDTPGGGSSGGGSSGGGTPKHYEGDKRATTTLYTPAESTGTTLGCQCEINNYKLNEDLANAGFFITAPAESMASPYAGSNGQCGTGTSADTLKTGTASTPCMSCWKLTPEDSSVDPINVVVGDACPNKDNPNICPKNPGDKNEDNATWGGVAGRHNHFDIFTSTGASASVPNWDALSAKWTGNSRVTFESMECPQNVKDIMRTNSCNC